TQREGGVAHALRLLREVGHAPDLGVDAGRLREFVDQVSRLYRPNPYHSWNHAVDVTHFLAWMLLRPQFQASLPAGDPFWMLLAALCHDVDHPGHDNQWEIATHSPLAARYSNEAVLEHHSVDVTLELLGRETCAFHRTMAPALQQRGPQLLRELILATDFSIHKPFVTRLAAALDAGPVKISPERPEFLLLVEQALVKAADIANTTRPFTVAKVWAQRVMEEIWAQGRKQREAGMPVPTLNDEQRTTLKQAQLGFLRNLAGDLFVELARVEPELQTLVQGIQANVQAYEALPG
ncbi:MAG TPA: 3',5'-cyclic nucleotide phosphodiesterase, partial [bacterium]|nr:3',5'-cyclic nucleotide phosphodiesterase [bacterium]